jgi:RND family efflux transporter MFP subunit
MEPPERQPRSDLPAGVAVTAGTAGPRLPAMRPQPAAPGPRPKRRVRIWAVGGLLAGAAALGFLFRPWASGLVAVAVEIVAVGPATRVLAVNGRIAALHAVEVRALVGGTLAEVSAAEGDRVERDRHLVLIDAAAQQAMVRQAVAGFDAALVDEAQATDTFARTEALGGNVSRSALEAAARAVQSASQEVARTTALVDQVRLQLDSYTIRAPMTGTVLALNVERGQSIDPTTVLMTIADLDRLVVETDVDEAYATQIRADLPAVLQLAGETIPRDGRVTRVSQQVDAATGGLAVELGFDQPVHAPVGLTVTINIIVDSLDAAITTPRAALVSTDAGDAVFVVTDGTARRHPVSVMDWPAARLIVTEGLTTGDVLILDATGILDGQAVRVAAP